MFIQGSLADLQETLGVKFKPKTHKQNTYTPFLQLLHRVTTTGRPGIDKLFASSRQKTRIDFPFLAGGGGVVNDVAFLLHHHVRRL